MSKAFQTADQHRRTDAHEHLLVRVTERATTKGTQTHDRTYVRCRACGQERLSEREFSKSCGAITFPGLLTSTGYEIDDPRTRRALTEEMVVAFGDIGPRYEVHSQSGRTYTVDLESKTCSCPDAEKRAPKGGCKHYRRVLFACEAGLVPGPEGVFAR
ncbi:hypothetical protein [Haloarchaeobius sp. TZWSO28]|uniref:hypothetical protein n=1 Tax=Haloarchaeobius sp. TZWSO28 TaxID=3446119 RepID=UPI003EBF5BEF